MEVLRMILALKCLKLIKPVFIQRLSLSIKTKHVRRFFDFITASVEMIKHLNTVQPYKC